MALSAVNSCYHTAIFCHTAISTQHHISTSSLATGTSYCRYQLHNALPLFSYAQNPLDPFPL